MSTQFPDDFDALQKRKPEHVLPSGESLQQFYDRIVETFTDVLKQHPTGRLLVVAHGGVLDCIYRHCTGEPLPTPRQWLLPNAAINVIRQSKPQTLEVLRWADQHHLNSDRGEDEVDGRIT